MVSTEPSLLRVGLTGGSACGCTTVYGILARLGACIVDMDEVGHGLTGPGGAAVDQVAAAFGERFRDAGGGIDRRAMGDLVFSDRQARARLERILHPLIIAESERIVADFAAEHGRGIAISDAALLVETGGYRRYDRLVVVFCHPALQLRRLMARDALSEARARARIAAQAPLEEKRLLADYTIDTSGTLADTEARAHGVYALLLDDLDRLPDLPDRRAR